MRYLIFLVLAVSSSLHAGSIQKWIDEDGNVHYGDAPPVSARTEDIKVQSAPSDPGKPLPRLSDDAAGADEDAGTEAGDNEQSAAGEKDASICARATNDLNIINTSLNIQLKQADGTTRYLNADEVKQRRARAEADIARHCN